VTSVVGMVDRFPMMLSFEQPQWAALGPLGGFIRAFGLDG
jgi:hypothetical protein